jgi:hypothetical protein
MVKKTGWVRRRRLRAGCLAAASLLVLAACTGDAAPEATEGQTPTEATNATEAFPEEVTAKGLAPGVFGDDSADVDNKYFPLRPGTQLSYEGAVTEDGERIRHRVVFTVTDLTKVIEGVRTVVAWDRDYTQGQLVEMELAFFAQDEQGNVWQLGEYPEEYEDGKLVDAPAWIAGLKGARAGIAMKAEPQLGASSYPQGYAPPPIRWIDRARVYRVGQETCVPSGCYRNVLVTEEFERNKPGAFQLKFYAPGVGNVRVGWRGAKEKERERLVLVDAVRLGPEALAQVRHEALELEARAYRISPDVYGRTAPSEVMQ